ncbi:MAG: cysteine hydrolase [Oscillospiraceae bacterium]|nr:cysteine hydrolase [Oscillospiraceae bacterium]
MSTKCALTVIDMQNGFINESSAQCIKGAKATVPACARVIEHCRACGVPVFFVSRKYRTDGSDVEHTRFQSWFDGGKALSDGCAEDISASAPKEFGICSRDYVIIKPRYSAVFHTELDLVLHRLGVNTVVLIGTTTPNCVRTTCYDGISLEYNVVVISDCTSSQTEEIQRSNLRDMKNVGAQVMTAEEFIAGAELTDSVTETRQAVAAMQGI